MKQKKILRLFLISLGAIVAGVTLWLAGNQIYQQHVISSQLTPTTIREIKKYAVMDNRSKWLKKYGSGHPQAKDLYTLDGIVEEANQHGSMMTLAQFKQTEESYNQMPTVETDAGVTTLTLPAFAFKYHGATSKKFIKIANQAILQAKNKLVIDLRNNPGGDLSAALFSIAPLLKDGKVLAGVNNHNRSIGFYLKGNTLTDKLSGKSMTDHTTVASIQKKRNLKIAILTNHETASAAEIELIALRHNPNVHVIGQTTTGDTSINTGIIHAYFNFKTFLTLTVAWVQDTQGHIYHNEPLKPDLYAKTDQQYDQAVRKIFNE